MSFDSNVKAALNGKKLDDLQDIKKEVVNQHTVIPTPAMVMQVIDALRAGTELRKIQLEIRQNKRILSMGQIKEINRARKAKITELQTAESKQSLEEISNG